MIVSKVKAPATETKEKHDTTSDMSLNTVQNLQAMEQQLCQYEVDIRKHISIEHQLQLYAEDLKKTMQQVDKEKELTD